MAEPIEADSVPARSRMLPYGRQCIDEDDIAAVMAVLRSDWLTTGPNIAEFEAAFAQFAGTREAVAVSSGTAALHCAMDALGIGPGDEVLVPSMTFAASANCVVYQGGTPIFTDVDAGTLLIDPDQIERRLTPRTKAIVAVDYAGHPCDYDALRGICDRHGLALVADACHAVGGSYKGRPVGSRADLSTFSLQPVKHITTGEGGVITTDDVDQARRMRTFRNHGITTDHRQRESLGSWFYEMVELGYNYRLTDFQSALGASQLKKLPGWIIRRNAIADKYDQAFGQSLQIQPLKRQSGIVHAFHLYVIRLNLDRISATRGQIFAALRARNIGVNVHYVPVHLHPYYQRVFGTGPGLCPIAEAAYECIISLPLFPTMTDDDIQYVILTVNEIVNEDPVAQVLEE